MKYNSEKSNIMVFGNKKIIDEIPVKDEWQLGNEIIRNTTDYQYLGVNLSSETENYWDSFQNSALKKVEC